MAKDGEKTTDGANCDPWNESSDASKSNGPDNAESQDDKSNQFEDSFVQNGPIKSLAEKLPDSAEYLSALESKLSKVQKRTGTLLKDLTLKREDEMRRLLDGAAMAVQNEAYGDTEACGDNPILRRIAPEKQALTEEEKIALLKADSLQNKEAEEEPKEEINKEDDTKASH